MPFQTPGKKVHLPVFTHIAGDCVVGRFITTVIDDFFESSKDTFFHQINGVILISINY